MPVLFLFVLLPLVEIALFIAIGARIGLLATLALILLSAALGLWVLRDQRDRIFAVLEREVRVRPLAFLAQGTFRVVAGGLLVLPGFLTDVLGLVLLVPAVQRMILRALQARGAVVAAARWQQSDVVEGEYRVQDPAPAPARGPLGPDHRLEHPRSH